MALTAGGNHRSASSETQAQPVLLAHKLMDRGPQTAQSHNHLSQCLVNVHQHAYLELPPTCHTVNRQSTSQTSGQLAASLVLSLGPCPAELQVINRCMILGKEEDMLGVLSLLNFQTKRRHMVNHVQK